MDNKKVHSVIEELFSVDGALGKYRLQYEAEMINCFLRDNAESLSKQIIAEIGEKFEQHAAISNKEEQPVVPLINIAETNESCANDTISDDKSHEGNQQHSENIPPESQNQVVVTETQSVAAVIVEPAPTKLTELPSVDSMSTPVQILNRQLQDKPNQSHAPGGDAVPRKFLLKLKGGKLQAGVPYEGKIEFSEGSPGVTPRILNVEMPPELGLQFDKDDPARIFGIPTIGGDMTLLTKYSLDASGSDPIELIYPIVEFVNHDPKTLWKNLPSDIHGAYWKQDVDSILFEVGDRKIVAASQRGRSHAHEGKYREDDFLIHVSSEFGWNIIAVADGAGSAKISRRGSQIAVNTVVKELLELLAGEEGAKLEKIVSEWHKEGMTREQVVAMGLYPVLGIAAFKSCQAIEEEAKAAGVAAKEFSTTLLVTVYKKMSFGNFFATYWVGDGGVGICLKDGTPKLLGKVDSGEYAGQTRFLDYKVMTTEEITARLHFEVVDEFRALVAMTDGITDPWFMTDNNLERLEYWEKLWAEVEPALKSDDPAASLLAWLGFWSPGNHDDRTIAILW